MRDGTGTRAASALNMLDMHKRFGHTQALDGASLEVEKGTIHALIGGNGSGKSTLVKSLAGVVAADDGTIVVREVPYDARTQTPDRARDLGLHFVHQQDSTFPDLTIMENLTLGRGFESGFGGRVRWSAVRRRVATVLARFEIKATPDTMLRELNPAMAMMVAIARALQDQEGAHDALLVLDEPTASLPQHEVSVLLSALRKYAAGGQTIVYVSHRLEEVRQIATRITVLRDGRVAGTLERAEATHDRLVELMMGAAIERLSSGASRVPTAQSTSVLTARGLAHGEVNLKLKSGEIVGLAGILGSGRTTLLRQLFGAADRPASCRVEVDGAEVPAGGPNAAMRAGLAYVPEDRLGEAAFPDMTLTDNLSVANLTQHSRYGYVNRRSERAAARGAASKFLVQTESELAPLSSLSGGNQQKVILARWLQRRPRVLLLDEPSQGVDVRARAEIHAVIRDAVRGGATALVVSSDFEELASLCDRVLVLQRWGGMVQMDDNQPVTETAITDLIQR